MKFGRHTCPCCGHQTLDQGPGRYETCPVCWWEDDLVYHDDERSLDGPNNMTLAEGQRRYRRYGVTSLHLIGQGRLPRPDEPLDPAWRPEPEPAWAEESLRVLPDFGELLLSAATQAQQVARSEGTERAEGHLDGLREVLGMLIEHAHRYGLNQSAFGVDGTLDLDRDLSTKRDTRHYAG